jgi:hypothetical protein
MLCPVNVPAAPSGNSSANTQRTDHIQHNRVELQRNLELFTALTSVPGRRSIDQETSHAHERDMSPC